MQFFKSKFFIALCAVLLFIGGFSLYTVTMTDGSAIGNVGKEIKVFFKGCIDSVGGFFAGGIDGLFNYSNVVKENEELREKLVEQEKELIVYGTLEEENNELKQLLGIVGEDKKYRTVECYAVSKADDDWFSVFTVNKGSSSGIEVGNAVVTSDGFVGIVSQVGLNWSMVVSVIDTTSNVGGIILRTGDAAVLKGNYDAMKNGCCRLEYISNDAIINRGDIVYTSGLGGVVPFGLKIGKITEVSSDSRGISMNAVVRPAVDFSKINKVYIITGESQE